MSKYLRYVPLLLIPAFLLVQCTMVPKENLGHFVMRPPSHTGIDFENRLGYTEDFNIYLYKSFYNGAGVGLGDFNQDGLLDVFFCGNQVDNRLYVNKGGFRFEDATQVAGVESQGSWSTGVSIVDINADGWLDIYVCKSGKPDSENRRNELFINTGRMDAQGFPHFENRAGAWGIDDLGFSVNATFFDYDQDGDLDMYLLNNSINPSDVVLDAKKGLREQYDPHGGNKLYKNMGDHFVDITVEAGIYGSAIGFGLGASVGDLNRDGWPDLYIANDFFEKDYLYLNKGDGTFFETVESSMAEISQGSMGVDIADLNNDGWQDIFVTEMLPDGNARTKTKVLFDDWNTYQLRIRNGYHRQFPRNALQLNRGHGTKKGSVVFSEISRLSGTAATEWSWGVHMLDLDNDTQKEIYITNGIVKDLLDQDYIDFYNSDQLRSIYREKGAVIKELVDNIPSGRVSNYLFKGQQGSLRFHDVAKSWGLATPSFSTGAAFGDMDNDGDLDLIVNNLNDGAFVYENKINGSQNFLNVQLHGQKANRQAIGSQVTLYIGDDVLFQETYPVRGTMSTMDSRLHFGLADHRHIDSLLIRWPTGENEIMYNVPANQFITVHQQADLRPSKLDWAAKSKKVLVEEVTDLYTMPYVHRENDYLDFERDNLRYWSIATEGPSMAVMDVNGDGLQDVFLCGAKGQPSQLFEQTEGKTFRSTNQSVFERDAQSEDLHTVFADIDNDGDQDLLVAAGGYEYPSASFALANRVYRNDGLGNFERLPQIIPNGNLSDTSCIVPSDLDGDGYLDLFIGTRAVPLSYGVPASSFILVNDGTGNFTDQTPSKAPGLIDLGMVKDALWFDFDRDRDQDLVVVGEFMRICLFENDRGRLVETTDEVGLGKTSGLWNTIVAQDLDGDGYEDLIVGNFGLNTLFRASQEHPLTLLVNDFDGNGAIDHVLCQYEGNDLYPISMKKDMVSQMPFLAKRFVKHSDFAKATIQDIFPADNLDKAIRLEAHMLESAIFWNNKGQFAKQALPTAAQFTTLYSIYPTDLDADGTMDLLLGGNLYRSKPQIGIQAGSQGICLKGMGDRMFQSLHYAESGFYAPGEIRDIQALESAGDKPCIVVVRNNEGPKIFEYEKDRP